MSESIWSIIKIISGDYLDPRDHILEKVGI